MSGYETGSGGGEPDREPSLDLSGGFHLPIEISGSVDGVPFTVRVGGPPVDVQTRQGTVRIAPRVDRDGFAVGASAELIEERASATIESAMSAEEWAMVREYGNQVSIEGLVAALDQHWQRIDNPGITKIIAALNDRLPDSDPRKITRERLHWLREAALHENGDETVFYAMLVEFADALESYLPPEA